MHVVRPAEPSTSDESLPRHFMSCDSSAPVLEYISAMMLLDPRLRLSLVRFTLQVRTGFTQSKMFDIVGMRLRHADAILDSMHAGSCSILLVACLVGENTIE